MAVFTFEGVGLDIDGRAILHDVDLEVPGEGVTAVVGPSGSGKSTLTRLCNRLIDPTSGVVRYRGADVRGLDVLGLRREVGMVFQRPTVFEGDVAANLAVTGVRDRARFDEVLRAVGLPPEEFLHRGADTLSGGEAQRLCLARTLLMDPKVLVADEPTASLDHEAVLELEALARRVAGSIPVLWVTHDRGQVERIADRRVVLAGGTVVR